MTENECHNCGRPIPDSARWCSAACEWWEDRRGGEDDEQENA